MTNLKPDFRGDSTRTLDATRMADCCPRGLGGAILRIRSISILVVACLLFGVGSASSQDSDWRAKVVSELPLMGHRNWIAVVDSAYPLQNSAGIETVETDGEQLDVVRTVLDSISKSKHVRPVIFTDAELKFVSEADAPGVTAYREALGHLLTGAQFMPHEQIIGKLDEAGKTFHILVLKTRMTIPYTSVFLRLDCGYWNDEQEKRLRERMAQH